MSLLVIISRAELDLAKESIDFFARHDRLRRENLSIWNQNDGSLVGDDGSPRTWREVPDGSTLIISKSVVHAPLQILRDSGCMVSSGISATHYFTKSNNSLAGVLKTHNLHWIDGAVELYETYDRRRSEITIEGWLDQYERFGDRGAGEAILRMLRVVKTSELVNGYAALPRLNISDRTPVAVLSRMGKSGASLSSILRNKLNREVEDISAAIEIISSLPGSHPLHVFEDGLWTGIELQRVIDSLCGLTTHMKVKPLSDPAMLRNVEIFLHFPLQTDLGIYSARSLLSQRGLTNITVCEDRSCIRLDVLSDDAKNRFSDGQLSYDDVLQNRLLDRDVSPVVSTISAPWLSERLRERAIKMLDRIGTQLFNFDRVDPSDRIGLPYGANRIGGNIVFSHGAPRASLPVYWQDGVVEIGPKKKMRWNPLTPEHHTPPA